MKSKIFFVSAAALALCSCNCAQPLECEVATWKGFSQSALSFTFDDGCPNQFTLAQPLFDRYDFKVTYYPVLMWTRSYEPLRAAVAAGHEVGCHTVRHPNLGEWTNEQVEAEYIENDQITRDSLGVQPITTAYPFCVRPQGDATAKHYIAARNCTGQIEPATPTDMLNVSSLVMGTMGEGNKTYADMLRIFDETQAKGGWTTLLYHEIGDGMGYSPFPVADLDSALFILNERREEIWVAPFGEVAKYIIERDATKVEASASEVEITVSATNNLNADIYNLPLTIRFAAPQDWTEVEAMQGEKPIENVCVSDGKISIDVVPNGGLVSLKKK